MMMHGTVGGLPTLAWALLLFTLCVYVVALMSREFLGNGQHPIVHDYFSDVPRAMVTTFRCSFGDCATIEGTPIFEHVDEAYGLGTSFMLCLFAFAMTIGMFNVISAIFVESTLAAATSLKLKQKNERLQDNALWSSRISLIVRRIGMLALDIGTEDKLSDYVDKIYELDVSCSLMDEIGCDPDVRAALEELDVDPEDHDNLSEILDVDQNGSVVVTELLQAIKRLRGNPRRSDIVTVDLMCRSILTSVKELNDSLLKLLRRERPTPVVR
eukprot:TRINITY_DN5647_c1_g1_i1.p1 TRINITY_DN5647_c1_g1~~TRINITY_DN5647_c1_g1_i1.p1  ORF type:complete len:270 (-),score=40.34 TRINITY_DN5647_c1_g1_i1:335-1144(-)